MNREPLAIGSPSLQASRLDLFVFGGAFLLGLAAYAILHLLRADQAWITAAIVIIMLLYAVIVSRIARLRVRLDQAGDNAYYLGLLFTLTSMAFALYEFRAASGQGTSGTDQIIGNFGIALATTITGIFLRVILHQMRVDPADIESMSRIELSDAAKRVRANLDRVSGDIGQFHNEVRQKSGDVFNLLLTDATKMMAGMSGEVSRSLGNMLEKASIAQSDILARTSELSVVLERVAGEAQGAAERLKKVEPPPLTLSRRLDKLSAVLEAMTFQLEALVLKFEGITTTATAASGALSKSAGSLTGFSEQLAKSQIDSAQQMSVAVKSVHDALEGIGKKLISDRHLLLEVENRSKAAADEALRAQESATTVLSRLADMTRSLTEFVNRAT